MVGKVPDQEEGDEGIESDDQEESDEEEAIRELETGRPNMNQQPVNRSR